MARLRQLHAPRFVLALRIPAVVLHRRQVAQGAVQSLLVVAPDDPPYHPRGQLLRQHTLLQQKRQKAEDKLFSGVLSDDAYRRHRPKINAELDEVESRLDELDQSLQFDADALREVLLFCRDLPNAYAQAPLKLKRHYLQVIFKRLIFKDRQIVEVVYTQFFAALG